MQVGSRVVPSWLPFQGVIMLRAQGSQPDFGGHTLVKQQRLTAIRNKCGCRFSCTAHVPSLVPLQAGPAAAVPPAMPMLLHVALVKVHVHKSPIHLQGREAEADMQQHTGSRPSNAAH